MSFTYCGSPAVGHGTRISGDQLSGNQLGRAVGPILRKEACQVVQRLEPVDVACAADQQGQRGLASAPYQSRLSLVIRKLKREHKAARYRF